jgi:hypothetical protein
MHNSSTITGSEFHSGDNVVLAEGPYQGTQGMFLNLTKDAHWAEIEERHSQGYDHRVRSHPVIWLKHGGD